MWSFSCWRQGEIERDPELRAGRALEELEGWPEDVSDGVVRMLTPFSTCLPLHHTHELLYCSQTWSTLLSLCTSRLIVCTVIPPPVAAAELGQEHAPEQDHRSFRRRQPLAVDLMVQAAGDQPDGRRRPLHDADPGYVRRRNVILHTLFSAGCFFQDNKFADRLFLYREHNVVGISC